MSKFAVLFVCLGNICRSPLAEAAFRLEAERLGLTVAVDSAGTGDWHQGHPPDPRARAVARRNGVDIEGYRARQVRADDFVRFTHIVAMDGENLANLERLKPAGAQAELSLMLHHAGRSGQSVEDPYYGGDDGFDVTWADVSAAARGLAQALHDGGA
jgi:protein-tyrosine phosphatase